MKFAQSLNESLVPEWKAQYLDYKLGKKKLKRLQNGIDSNSNFSPAMSALRSFRLNSVSHRNGHGANETSDFNETQEIDPNSPSGISTSTSRQNTNYDPDFQLPPPAMDSGSTDNGESTQTKPDDHTPLLGPQNHPHYDDEDSTHISLSPALNPHPSVLRKKSLLNNAAEGSSLKKVMSLKSILKKGSKSTLATPSTFLKRNSVHRVFTNHTEANGVPLQSTLETGRNEFIIWVDSEFDKIESFYINKERDCYNRFLVLQDQLYQLREQKVFLKSLKKRIEDGEHSNEALNNNLAYLAQQTKEKLYSINKFELPSLPPMKYIFGFGDTATDSAQLNQKQVNQLYHDENYNENQVRNGLKKAYELSSGNSKDSDSDTDFNHDPRNNDVEISNPQAHKHDSRQKTRDYQQRSKVPYLTAKRQLKAAIHEYYRSLELLKSYRMMNRTAFRKMIKKLDKTTSSNFLPLYMDKVNNSYFSTSDVLDSLIAKIEDLYSIYFEHGHKKIAVEKLRSKETPETFYMSLFSSGYLLGFGLPLLVLALYIALHKTLNGELLEGKYLLQIWGGFFLATLSCLLFGLNCYVWTVYKINYKFIFEFNVKTALDFKQFFLLPSISFFLLSLIGWFSFNNFWPEKFPGRDFPWFYVGFILVMFFWPFDQLYLSSRRWLQVALWRLFFSGFYPVEFRDFFLGDIFSSLTYSMGNISFFFCLYATDWKGAKDGTNNTKCGSTRSRLMGFFSTIPSIWRFLQCFRRYADTGDWFPHLANMLKYGITATYYMCLSVYRIDRSISHRAVFIVFASINSMYSASWDIFMDWSLFQSNSKHKFLRNDLVFKKPIFYYSAMVLDVILRFQWIFYCFFSNQIQQSAVTSFCIALAEVLRRFIWIFFRMENEHCSNVNLFRASRETPLPYPTFRVKTIRSRRQPSFAAEPNTAASFGDDESIIGIPQSTGYDATSQPQSQSAANSTVSKRRPTFSTTVQVLNTVSRALTNAHIKDFQRRKVRDEQEEKDSSDEDDDDDDIHSIQSDNGETDEHNPDPVVAQD